MEDEATIYLKKGSVNAVGRNGQQTVSASQEVRGEYQ